MILHWQDSADREGDIDTDDVPPFLPKDAPMLVVAKLFGSKNRNPEAALVDQVTIHYNDGSMVHVWDERTEVEN